ncbi:quinone-dependent dihydroorotate dehydrogenase [Kocuria sediminis]|uniref:Dihydroorotate dehydrogenase (quinone) n=1 Tax=Kocuria sediminis TaxID=1038857 RepID=A0A6N8GIZ1_9MICC|nr:quinone-dependent dihydroorotate dehydrogenase [Kocuria sediminis]MUN62709.1 quinone-dependent dihydroorotate dehydrogenase [Kocuria sediminis]
MRFYPMFFQAVFSRMDAEKAHRVGFAGVRATRAVRLSTALRVYTRADPALEVEALGLRFPSPFGLAAGFDKGAEGIGALTDLGFGHVEIGTVTAQAQPGNPRPRLFRLVRDRAVVNRMGFNNDGAEAVAPRLARARRELETDHRGRARPVLGVNIGKTKVVPLEDAVDDYLQSTRTLAPLADYLVVNVSSPNTPGLRQLQEIESLRPLLAAVGAAADEAADRHVPLLVKIAPDLSDEDVAAVADLALDLGLDGIVATNTTISREGLASDPAEVEACGAGGLSGAPLRRRSLEVLRLLRERVGDRLVLVSVGGVTTAEDVQERLAAGATLVQGYTGFLYEGPFWARSINQGLTRLARRRG